MPIVLDYKLCDGVEWCPAITMCDSDSLYFDKATGRVEYDKDSCRNCGTCANYCGMNAIMFAPTDEEWEELRTLVESPGE